MRDLASILREELESLEAELAADPRFHKSQKIRELLEMYEGARYTLAIGATAERRITAAALSKTRSVRNRLLSALASLIRPGGTATLARARLREMAQTKHGSNDPTKWLQKQMDPTGNPMSAKNVLAVSPNTPSASVIIV